MSADWNAIRADYESGVSLRQLAIKYDVSKTYIIEKRNKEAWNRPDRPTANRPMTDRPPTPIAHLPIPDDAATIARIGLHQLAQHLQTDELLPISSHKSLSDALAQYVKVLIVAPRETEAQDVLSVPLNKISPRTRLAIQRLLDEDERAQEQEKVS